MEKIQKMKSRQLMKVLSLSRNKIQSQLMLLSKLKIPNRINLKMLRMMKNLNWLQMMKTKKPSLQKTNHKIKFPRIFRLINKLKINLMK